MSQVNHPKPAVCATLPAHPHSKKSIKNQSPERERARERERERERERARARVITGESVEGSLAHIKGEEERATNEFVRGKPLRLR